MDLTLTRTQLRSDGIFGTLASSDGSFSCVTLEHSYPDGNGGFAPKIPVGTYTCVRGQHQLASMTQPFTTFEVTNVPGHSNILIHMGNYNADSEGCILVGEAISSANGAEMITNSRATFAKFILLEAGQDSFILTVR